MPTYLLTWNPQRWPWADLAAEARRLRRGREVEDRWGCGRARSLKPGDRFFLLRQGRPPRGIVASGRVASVPRAEPHWEPEKRAKGVAALCVRVRFDVLLEPERERPLGVGELTRGPLADVHWRTQISGIRIADDAAGLLEALWKAHVAGQRDPRRTCYPRPRKGRQR